MKCKFQDKLYQIYFASIQMNKRRYFGSFFILKEMH